MLDSISQYVCRQSKRRKSDREGQELNKQRFNLPQRPPFKIHRMLRSRFQIPGEVLFIFPDHLPQFPYFPTSGVLSSFCSHPLMEIK